MRLEISEAVDHLMLRTELPLEDQQVLLSTDSSLQTLKRIHDAQILKSCHFDT